MKLLFLVLVKLNSIICENNPRLDESRGFPIHLLFNRTLRVDGSDFVAAADVLVRGQRVCAHPDFDNAHRQDAADDLPADAQDVRVVVLARQLRAQRVLAHTGEDAAQLVGAIIALP